MRNAIHALAAAAVVLSAGCTVQNQVLPSVASPSGQSTALRLTATPNSVPQDGTTPSRILIEAFDAVGKPFPSLTLVMSVIGPGNLSASSVTTGSDGKASVVFVAPLSNGGQTSSLVGAVPAGSPSKPATVSVVLQPIVPQPPVVVTPNSAPPSVDFTFSPTQPLAGQSVFFNAVQSKAAAGHAIVGYNWDFGDGSTDTTSGVNPSHSFGAAGTYNVSLTVIDDVGAKATKTTGIPISAGKPTASFTVVSPTAPFTHPVTIVFDASASSALGGATIAAYTWLFGDGTGAVGPQSSPNVNHLFNAAGSFPVQLTVTDSAGRTATVTQTIQIN